MALRIKSAKKKHRQSLKRRARNRYVISTLKTKIKKFKLTIEEKDVEKSSDLLRDLASAFDKASAKGILHKKNSSRNIANFSRKFAVLSKSFTQD